MLKLDWDHWYSHARGWITSLSSPDAFTPITPLTGFISNMPPSLVWGR